MFFGEYTAKQIVSNMRTKSTAKQTNGSGFIGYVYYGNDGWLNNSIAIGEAGEDSTKGSIGKAYNFTSTKTRTICLFCCRFCSHIRNYLFCSIFSKKLISSK